MTKKKLVMRKNEITSGYLTKLVIRNIPKLFLTDDL